jgi:multiple sugar transport system substrate-binding protein
MKFGWRNFSVLLSVLFLLAACNGKNPQMTETPGVSKTQSIVTPTQKTNQATAVPDINVDSDKLKGIQIEFVHPWTGKSERVVAQLVDQFNQTNEWKIFVNAKASGSQGLVTQDFLEAVNNAQPLDVVVAPLWLLQSSDEKNQNIVDLNTYVNSKQFGLSEKEVDSFLPVFWDEDVVDGKRFGIPAQRNASVLIYNKTWANELGFSAIPTTPQELRDQLCAANASMKKDADQTNDGLGGWIVNTDGLTTLSWFNSFSFPLPVDSYKNFSDPKTQEAFEYLHKLQKDSCAWNSKVAEPYKYFIERKTLVYSATLQDLMLQSDYSSFSASKDEWVMIPYPTTSTATILTEGASFGILTSTEDRQLAAWLFVRWLSQPEQQVRLLQTTGTLPLGSGVLSLMSDFRISYPEWDGVIDLLPELQPLPQQSNLNIVKIVLEDAAWQLFKTDIKTEQIPGILTQTDTMIQELMDKQQ